MGIKIFLVLVFFAVMIYNGFMAKRSTLTSEGFALGDRGIGPWLAASAFGTTYFSAVIFIGTSGQYGWKMGVALMWAALAACLFSSLLCWSLLAKKSMNISHKLMCKTLPEFFEKRYQSKSLRIALSLIIALFMIPYTASLYNGLSRLFAMAFNIDYVICIIIMAALTGIYVIAGGFLGAVRNNLVQAVVMFFGIFIIISALLKLQGGWEQALIALSMFPGENGMQGAYVSFFGADPKGVLAFSIMIGFGSFGMPQMLQNFFALKGENAVRPGMVISAVFSLFLAGGCYFIGSLGRIFVDDTFVAMHGFDAIVPYMISLTSDTVIGITVILVLAASMSTLSSLVINSSNTVTFDLINSARKTPMSEKQKVATLRFFIVFFITISALIAIIQYKYAISFIAQLFGMTWGAVCGPVIGPYFYSVYWKKTHPAGIWASYIFGPTLMTLNMFFRNILPPFLHNTMYCADIAMASGMVLVPLVSMIANAFSKKELSPEVEKIFEEIA